VGTSIKPMGGVEGSSEYHKEFQEKKGERADFVAVNDLLTPYGHLQNEAKSLGLATPLNPREKREIRF